MYFTQKKVVCSADKIWLCLTGNHGAIESGTIDTFWGSFFPVSVSLCKYWHGQIVKLSGWVEGRRIFGRALKHAMARVGFFPKNFWLFLFEKSFETVGPMYHNLSLSFDTDRSFFSTFPTNLKKTFS